MDPIEKYTERQKEKYEKHLAKHDPNSPEATHQVGKEKVWLRFKILSQIANLNGIKILDFGCGTGLMLDFLKENFKDFEYHGWDISEKMIQISQKRHPGAKFLVYDVLKDELSGYNNFFDYILINGVFNLKAGAKIETHEAWLKEILLKLWTLCKGGIAVNFLTEYVDWQEKELYYCPIEKIMYFCVKNLSRWFEIRHDYERWEFTMYIYKQPKVKL